MKHTKRISDVKEGITAALFIIILFLAFDRWVEITGTLLAAVLR